MTATRTNHHDWREAGQAWGLRADDWSCLYEQYSRDITTLLLAALGDLTNRRVLDIACGAGLVSRQLALRGAQVTGIDASEELIDIARRRSPRSCFVVGSMFDLPWSDGQFDLVVAINGIWGGCEEALREAHRVTRPGGLLGLTFWGNGRPNDLRATFKTFARHAPREHFGAMKALNNIAHPGVVDSMLANAGYQITAHGSCPAMLEWPDDDIAWRAIASTGPAVPALRAADPIGTPQRPAPVHPTASRTPVARTASSTSISTSSPDGQDPEAGRAWTGSGATSCGAISWERAGYGATLHQTGRLTVPFSGSRGVLPAALRMRGRNVAGIGRG